MSYQHQVIEGLGEICLIKERWHKSKFHGYCCGGREKFIVFGMSVDEVVFGLFSEFGYN